VKPAEHVTADLVVLRNWIDRSLQRLHDNPEMTLGEAYGLLGDIVSITLQAMDDLVDPDQDEDTDEPCYRP
jgi:hypothetical protein